MTNWKNVPVSFMDQEVCELPETYTQINVIMFCTGFSILSGVEILFFMAKFFFSLRKTRIEVKESRMKKDTMSGAEPDDTLQLRELNINK